MAEGNKKSGGSYKPQSAVTIGRNKRLKGERHAKRMAEQMSRTPLFGADMPKVPRGTARDIRRKPLQAHYAKAALKAAQVAAQMQAG